MASEQQLLEELEKWLADQPRPPTIFEVAETGNVGLLAAFILKGFREAAARAVESRERLSKVRDEISEAYAGDKDRVERFLRTAHPLLRGELPLKVAQRSDEEAEEIIALARVEVVGPALRVLDRISEVWGLTRTEQASLLGVRPGTLHRWRSAPPDNLPAQVIERLSLALGIFKAINILLPIPERADGWIRRPNAAPIFRGSSALKLMLSGIDGLRKVRTYLEDQI